MRCSEVIHQLRTSRGGFDLNLDPAVSDHLTSCSDCAGWAEDDAQVLRAWQATRPLEPSAEVWNALWARVSDGLDAAQRPRVLTMPEQPAAARRFRPGLVALGLAQAAAILVAVLLLPGRHPHEGKPIESLAQVSDIPVAGNQVEFDPGQVAMIYEKMGQWFKKVPKDKLDGTHDETSSDQLDGDYDMFNVVEAMADVDRTDTR
jgi:hypothetical protein